MIRFFVAIRSHVWTHINMRNFRCYPYTYMFRCARLSNLGQEHVANMEQKTNHKQIINEYFCIRIEPNDDESSVVQRRYQWEQANSIAALSIAQRCRIVGILLNLKKKTQSSAWRRSFENELEVVIDFLASAFERWSVPSGRATIHCTPNRSTDTTRNRKCQVHFSCQQRRENDRLWINLTCFLVKIDFMRRFGYLDKASSRSESLYSEDAIVNAIKNVQKYGALNETGVLDNETLQVLCLSNTTTKIIEMNKNFFFIMNILDSWWRLHDVAYQTFQPNQNRIDGISDSPLVRMVGRSVGSRISK